MVDLGNQQIIDTAYGEHLQRISFLTPSRIKRTYPKLFRVESSSKVMLEFWTDYWVNTYD